MNLPERVAAIVAGEAPLPAYDRHMGFRLDAWAGDGATMSCDVGPHLHNPAGAVQGGVMAGLADAAMGLTVCGTLPPGTTATNTELHTRFLHPATGTITAQAKVLRRGRRVIAMACDVVDGDGRLVATASSTFLLLEAERPGPSNH